MIRSAAHMEMQERGSSFLLYDWRCQQLGACYAVTFRTVYRSCHLLRSYVVRSIRYGITAFRVRRRRRFADHLQRLSLLSHDWRPGHIPRFMYVCNEASNVHILVIARVRKVRRQGHIVSTRIIRRALTASCDRFVNVVTKSRQDMHGQSASRVTLLVGYLERGVVQGGRRAEDDRSQWMNAASWYVQESMCCRCVARVAWSSRRRNDGKLALWAASCAVSDWTVSATAAAAVRSGALPAAELLFV